jgi:hypothetical protein
MSNSKNTSMNTPANPSTGPKTEEGKAITSKNAIKAGIFYQGYLPSEDPAAKQQEFEAMAQEWGVSSPTGIHFLRDIAQANLAQERLMQAERLIVEGVMQSAEVGEHFAKAAGFDLLMARQFPSWYFLEDDGGNKAHAIYLDKVLDQAMHLKAHYSDTYVAQAATRYPDLYHYVLTGYQPNSPFALVLGKKYKQSVATLNLAAIGNELKEGFRYHLAWAQEPRRYQTIIDGLRAQKIVEVLDFDKSNRYLTAFQNRRIRALHGLDTLQRREQEQQRLALAQEAIPVIAAETKVKAKRATKLAAKPAAAVEATAPVMDAPQE